MPAPRILVVDDEPLIRWSLVTHLGQAGYTVESADCGRTARECLAGDFDLVLLDLKLPDVDGLSLLEQILLEKPGCPVILMTAYGSPETTRRAVSLGAVRVVNKPVSLDRISEMVENTIRPNQAQAEHPLRRKTGA